MPLRLAQQLIESGAQFPSFFASEHFLDPATVVLQYLLRHEQLTPRSIQRQRRHHLRDALCQARVAREMLDLFRRLPGDQGR